MLIDVYFAIEVHRQRHQELLRRVKAARLPRESRRVADEPEEISAPAPGVKGGAAWAA